MHQIEVVLLILRNCDLRRISPSRTQIQKMVYFASEPLKLQLHRPHYYGPYSVEVTDAIRDLVASNLVIEDCEMFEGAWDKDTIRRYSYELTKEGNEISDILTAAYQSESKLVDHCMDQLNVIGFDQKDLSLAAKIHFILMRFRDVENKDIEKIILRAEQLGWNVSEKDAFEKIEQLIKSGFVPTAEQSS